MAHRKPYQRNPERAQRHQETQDAGAARAARAARWAAQPRCFRDFDSYVALFPAGEAYRNWLVARNVVYVPAEVHSPHLLPSEYPDRKKGSYLRIIQGTGPHGGIPGDYVWARIGYRRDEALPFVVVVHDCDDGFVVQQFGALAAAEAALDELCDLAPCALNDLCAFGYQFEG